MKLSVYVTINYNEEIIITEEIYMITLNGDYKKLRGNFLFTEIAKRTNDFIAAHPDADVIKIGIGDVVRPLVPAVINALHKAVDDMGTYEGFHGYGPELGYSFLKDKILLKDYKERGIDIAYDELFVSCGTKCDTSAIQELFSKDTVIAVTDPVYPVYVATNVMAGRSGAFDDVLQGYNGIVYLPCTEDNNFIPELPKQKVDAIYLCYPNNPTGLALKRDELKVWVDYARKTGAIILYDNAYEVFITEDDVPHSIYEIDGAKEVAIEFRSFSKIAGFTGTRLSYSVVPKELKRIDENGDMVSLNAMWTQRQTMKYNGAPYIIQRGAEAIYTDEGRAQVMAEIGYYMENARIMREGLREAGFTVYGGVDAPYIWLKAPGGDSWAFFDRLLNEYHVVGAPGVGFGPSGEGFFRLSAFNSRENTLKAIDRIRKGIK